jgi:hypothetical protein
MVWVYEMARYQVGGPFKSGDKRCIGIQREYLALPSNPFLGAFFDKYQKDYHLTEKRGNSEGNSETPSEGPSKALGSKETETETETEKDRASRDAQAPAPAPAPAPTPERATPTRAGQYAKAMRAAGLGTTNPGHPKFIALIEAGATESEFVDGAREAVERGSTFAYALGVVEGRRKEAAQTLKATNGHAPRKRGSTATERSAATLRGLTGGTDVQRDHPPPADADIVDVAARVIPEP